MTRMGARRASSFLSILLGVTFAIALASGCASGPSSSRASQGAATGAALGAGLGLLVGVLSGDSDRAARAIAVGAASGAISGGYEGWRQDQEDERTRQVTQAIRESSAQQAALDDAARRREELTRFLGAWDVQGWVDDDGARRNITATVYGDVQMMQFVELAWIDLKVQGLEGQIWGTTMLGYSADNGYSISSRFNTSPDSFGFASGTFDSAQRSFSFIDGQDVTSIRFSTPDRFTATTTSGARTLESYTFTRT